jgi:hypothetical protein
MRFMTIVKGYNSVGVPPKALMDAIGKLGAEAVEAGTLIQTGGLAPTADGAKVQISNHNITITDGPFTEAKEVIGGYAVFELKSKQEAIEQTVRFMELHKQLWPEWEGETEVRQMIEWQHFPRTDGGA